MYDGPNPNKGAGPIVAGLVVLVALLMLPVLALHRLGIDLRWVGAGGLGLSALTYWAYACDKRRAQQRASRVSEAHLHLLEILGGWPGAWMAQRRLRHKCSKVSYQVVFWLIVLGYQLAAFDCFQDWQLSRAALKWFEEDRQGDTHVGEKSFGGAKAS